MSSTNKTNFLPNGLARCLARRTGDTEGHLTFGDKKHNFYAEERCWRRVAVGNKTLCRTCIKNTTLSKSGYAGLMTDPIPAISHIYGGEWYKTKVVVWGEPSDEHLAIAKDFQRKALNATPDSVKPVIAAPLVALQPVKTRVFKVITQQKAIAAPLIAAQPVKTRKFKVVTQQKSVVANAVAFFEKRETPLAVESTEEPLEDLSVTHINVRKQYVPVLGRDCFIDKESGDAYEIHASGGVGKKIEDDDY